MKFRKKLLVTLTFVAMLVFMLAMTALAQEITITFYNGSSVDTTVGTSGKLELEAGTEFKLPTKDVDTGYSFNWTTNDGRAWAGGSTISLNEDTELRQVVALDVADYATFKSCASSGTTIRLTADITVPNEQVGTVNWATFMVLLNGHNITFTRTSGTAIGGQRTGTLFYGVGKITYTGNQFQHAKNHGWGGDCCRLFVGRDVELYAPNAILVYDDDGYVTQGYPYIQIFGKVTCKTILEMRNGGSRDPRVEINEGAYVRVTGEIIRHTVAGNSISVNVRGGTIIMENSTYSFFRDQKAKYNLTGGNFLFAEETDFTEIDKYLSNADYKIVKLTLNGESYQCVIPYSCGTVAGREHNFKLASSTNATCCSFKTDIFRCENCSHEIEFRYGDRANHDFKFVESKPATKTELGWEKYACNDCQSVEFIFITYDPSNDTVKVTVNKGTGDVTIEVAIKDVYSLEKVGDGYTITDVKAFGEYALNQIVKLYVPLGITNINLKTTNTYVKEFIVDDGAEVIITSIAKLTALETVTIKGATVTFKSSCTANSVKTINAVTAGANITFDQNSFLSRTNLSAINMVAGATYSFGANSFRDTSALKEVIFVDNSTVKFVGDAAFYNTGAEYVYVGKGITELSKKPFDNAKKLKLAILMDVTTISDYAFCALPSGAKVFHHATTLTLGNNAFNSSHDIQLYTKAATTNASAFASCSSYTIHYGIEHEYEKHTDDATCTKEGGVSYTTSCVCGVNTDGIYKKYVKNVTSSSDYEIVEQINMVTPTVAHNLNVLVGIKYEGGFARKGVGEYECSWCNLKKTETVATQAPIFSCLGYSARTYGGFAVAVKYEINRQSVENYEAINNVKLDFGLIVGNKDVLNNNTPLNSAGNANKGCAKYSMVSNNYEVYELTIKNIPTQNLDSYYVLSAYIYDGKKSYYIQENETVENPSGVCYNEIYDIGRMR